MTTAKTFIFLSLPAAFTTQVTVDASFNSATKIKIMHLAGGRRAG